MHNPKIVNNSGCLAIKFLMFELISFSFSISHSPFKFQYYYVSNYIIKTLYKKSAPILTFPQREGMRQAWSSPSLCEGGLGWVTAKQKEFFYKKAPILTCLFAGVKRVCGFCLRKTPPLSAGKPLPSKGRDALGWRSPSLSEGTDFR